MFEYKTPFSEYTMDRVNCCKLCLEEGRMVAMRGLEVGARVFTDVDGWLCCPRCYHEQKRLGKVW